MIVLKVFEDSILIFEKEFHEHAELSVGRGSECDILLNPHPGISRKHAQIIIDQDSLSMDLLSSTGKMIHGGKSTSKFTLQSASDTVSIPPYDFNISREENVLEQEEQENSESDSASSQAENTPENHDLSANQSILAEEKNTESSKPKENPFEKTEVTSVGRQLNLEYYVSVFKDDRLLQDLLIEGSTWTFGRASTCDYAIQTKKASRKHFSILRNDDKFAIKDLGSSNGTLLNKQPLPANQEIDLKSGDYIEVGEYKFIFEIKDLNFQEKIKEVALLEEHMGADELSPQATANAIVLSDEKLHLPDPESLEESQKNAKNKKIRIALLSLIILVGAFLYLNPQEDQVSQAELASKAKEAQLEKERLNAAKDKFNLALRFYSESQFERCILEIDEFLNLGIETEDTAGAQELRNQCDIEKERLQRQRDLELQEQKRLAIAAQVQKIIDGCRDQISFGTDALKSCLSQAIDLDPSNEQIAALLDEAEAIALKKEQDEEARQRYLSRVSKGKALFKKAKNYDKNGDWKRALKAYDKHIKSSYPDPGKLKKQSKRNIASINMDISNILKDALKLAKDHMDQGEYKESILAANKGLEVNRDHEELLAIKAEADKLLTTIVRRYYQESIIEEDYGQVDEAKIKWKKIINLAVAGTDYYKKAKNKLRYYEEGPKGEY